MFFLLGAVSALVLFVLSALLGFGSSQLLIISLAFLVSTSELLFHAHLSRRKVSGFPVRYGVYSKLFHFAALFLLISLFEFDISANLSIFILIVLISVAMFPERAAFPKNIPKVKIREVFGVLQVSYVYWFNSIISIAFLNFPQFAIADRGAIEDINFYRIVVAGPIFATILVQVILPFYSPFLTALCRAGKLKSARSSLLLAWLGISLITAATVWLGLLIFRELGLFNSGINLMLSLPTIFIFALSGANSIIIGGMGAFQQPKKFIYSQIIFKLFAIIFVASGYDVIGSLLFSHVLMILAACISIFFVFGFAERNNEKIKFIH